MVDHLKTVNTRQTRQDQRARADQVQNAAGGYVFQVNELTRLRRFLTLGVDGGTYYANARDHTLDNADVVLQFARTRCVELVHEIVNVSVAGRAPRQNPVLFALAAAASLGDDEGRKLALGTLSTVARTGTHLFIFVGYVEQFRGWGRGLRRAVANWYLDKTPADLAYQVVKYRQREGWSQRDLLRLSHPKTNDASHRRVFEWACGVNAEPDATATELSDLRVLEGWRRANAPGATPGRIAGIVHEHGLSWEMLPDSALGERIVWEALLERGMPQTALMRQLPRLTRLGLLTPLAGEWTTRVAQQLSDSRRLKKARVHPINVLVAQRTYASGHSVRGSSTWAPSHVIVDALDAAFYAAFDAVQPSGKRFLLALDVSDSMGSPAGDLPINCREASAALALVTAATEPAYDIVGFTTDTPWDRRKTTLTSLPISPRQRLDDVIRTIAGLEFGATDCALPILHATRNNLQVDTFVIYTDNETWHGQVHPYQALREYRQRSGIDAKLIVVGMTATRFSIADPRDPGMLDIAGFDSAVPTLINDFASGGM